MSEQYLNHWVRMRRMTGETQWEAKCDVLPDVCGYGDTAEEAYEAVCVAIDALLPDLAKRAQRLAGKPGEGK